MCQFIDSDTIILQMSHEPNIRATLLPGVLPQNPMSLQQDGVIRCAPPEGTLVEKL